MQIQMILTPLFWAFFAASAGAQKPYTPQSLIDRAVLQIVSTETGQRALCPFAESAEAMRDYIGTSAGASDQIKKICNGRYITKITKHTIWMMSSNMNFMPGAKTKDPLAPGKTFLVVVPKEKYKSIMSYTDMYNVTYLMMTSKELHSNTELVRAIAHEYAMSYDRLARLGYLVDPTTWEQGLNLAFDRPVYTLDPIFERKSNDENRVINCALRDPSIRYALATERAYRFEDAIIEELGLLAESPRVASGSFSAAIQRNAKLYKQFEDLIKDERTIHNHLCNKKEPGTPQEQFARRVSLLDSMVLKFHGRNQTMRMQDLLVQPAVGPFHRDSEGGGPRPRAGGFGDGE